VSVPVFMLKIELHTHTDHDPLDRIPHTSRELIDHAAALGYHGLAITLHNRFYDPAVDAGYARDRGVVLIPGIERTIRGRHVLLINFPAECESVKSFEEVAALKARCAGLVVAPHPFYPTGNSVGRHLDAHHALFDAVELNAMYTSWLNFNRRALAWARARGKPIVGNTDLHRLEQLGTTYSLVDAEPRPDAICDAIRAGRVEVRSDPLSSIRAGLIFTKMCVVGSLGRTIGAGGHRH
jgi:predicted metal-dependent phosphoesterase TrpH